MERIQVRILGTETPTGQAKEIRSEIRSGQAQQTQESDEHRGLRRSRAGAISVQMWTGQHPQMPVPRR